MGAFHVRKNGLVWAKGSSATSTIMLLPTSTLTFLSTLTKLGRFIFIHSLVEREKKSDLRDSNSGHLGSKKESITSL